MRFHVTRDSVAMGDDIDAPHDRHFSFPDDISVEEAIERIVASGYLAQIAGGRATWSVVSGFPICVVAQQWAAPKPIGWEAVAPSSLQSVDGTLRLRFNYHAQIDPEIVVAVIRRLQLSAL